MENSSTIGSRTEGIILAALLQAGKRILLPFGDGHRYDLAIDDEGQLKRIQCKTARYEDGALVFNAHSNSRSGKNVSYYGHADIFAAYAPHTGKVYLVPVDEVGDSQVRLRLVPTRSGQVRRIRWAKDYELHFVQDKTPLKIRGKHEEVLHG